MAQSPRDASTQRTKYHRINAELRKSSTAPSHKLLPGFSDSETPPPFVIPRSASLQHARSHTIRSVFDGNSDSDEESSLEVHPIVPIHRKHHQHETTDGSVSTQREQITADTVISKSAAVNDASETHGTTVFRRHRSEPTAKTTTLDEPQSEKQRKTLSLRHNTRPEVGNDMYDYHINANAAKQDIIVQHIERLKIALTFLLHDESPLWTEEDDEIDEKHHGDDDDDAELYEKGFILVGTPNHAKRSKHDEQNFQNASRKAMRCAFQFRCSLYAQNMTMPKASRKSQEKLNSLFDDKYMDRFCAMHQLWRQWRRNAGRDQDIVMDDALCGDLRQHQDLLQVE